MSRIGKAPVIVPAGVTVQIKDQEVSVKGPKGELTRTFRPEISFKQEDGKVLVSLNTDNKGVRCLHGLSRTLLNNMVVGVSTGFNKTLEIVGVGYRAATEGNKLVMQLGYSHSVEVNPPEGISISVAKNNAITVSGADKQAVGDIASFIRGKRPPEVYKGKGIKYQGEFIRRKAGKAAGKKK